MPNDILFFQMLPLESIKKFLYDRLAFSSHNIILTNIRFFSYVDGPFVRTQERKRERERESKQKLSQNGIRVGGQTGDKTE